MKKLELNEWEVFYLAALLGGACGSDERPRILYNKTIALINNKLDYRSANESYGQVSFTNAADAALKAASMTPLEKLLTQNGYVKYENNYIKEAKTCKLVVSLDGSVNIKYDGRYQNLKIKVATEADITTLEKVF